ncbi:MAG: GntR family transcriptional regulator, partial [Planctomycetes bacterium]|nr:GntR family transcriptional regulator [Planctomycetota bacterium]
MFIRIENSSAVPVYRQIIDQIRYQVAAGVIRSGERLPSVRDLARQL